MASVIIKGVKTTYVDDEPWSSPDGKVTIWKVKLETPDGERQLYSTMSKQIASEGFSGDVELYTNTKGKEYVRKAPKEEHEAAGVDWDDKNNSIRAQFAIKAAVQASGEFPGGGDSSDHATYIDNVEFLARQFYDMVDRVKANERPPEPSLEEEEYNNETFGHPEGNYDEAR